MILKVWRQTPASPQRLSLRETSAWAGPIGLARPSNPGVPWRLDQAGGLLQALVGHLLAARADIAGLSWRGRRLRLVDGTGLSEPRGSGTDWRVYAVFDRAPGQPRPDEAPRDVAVEAAWGGAPPYLFQPPP